MLLKHLLGADSEHEFSKLLPQIVSESDCILDIGANIGQWALILSKLAPKGKIYSFEPIKSNYLILEKVISKMNLNNVSAFNIGLSNKSESAIMNIPVFKNSGIEVRTQASLQKHEISENAYFKEEKVEIRTLDEIFIQLNFQRIDLIKCDTEGEEINVLEGGASLVTKFKPILILETFHNNEGLNKWYTFGYLPYYASGGKIKPAFANPCTSDLIMIHSDDSWKYKSIITDLNNL